MPRLPVMRTAAHGASSGRLTLGQAYTHGFHLAQGNREIALGHVEKIIDRDRRFDAFKTDRLLERFEQCRGTGGFLDFDDPYLRGGEGKPALLRRGSASLG
jgi:hypothetical protein